jgi:hypothetical protein
MRSGGGLLAGSVIVPADNRTGRGRRIGDFDCLLCRRVYGEVLTFEFSHSPDLVRIEKRCIPNIVTEVPHLNLNLTFERSGYDDFLVCHMGLNSNSGGRRSALGKVSVFQVSRSPSASESWPGPASALGRSSSRVPCFLYVPLTDSSSAWLGGNT